MGRLHGVVSALMILTLVIMAVCVIEWYWVFATVQTLGAVKELVIIAVVIAIVAGVVRFRGL